MALSTRHLQRKNIRNSIKDSDDNFTDEPRDIFGGEATRQNPMTQPSRPFPAKHGQESSVVLDALSDGTSRMARFLLVNSRGANNAKGNDNDGSSWLFPNAQNNAEESNAEDDMPPRMDSMDVNFFALALEPKHVRNERIIMLFEAYALFGALLVTCVWVIYEWGSAKGEGFGGDGSDEVAGRIFECIMASALGCNIIIAFYGASFWMLSINFSSSHEDFVFHSIKPLSFLASLFVFTSLLVIAGLFLGIYLNLSPHWPETIVTLIIVVGVYLLANKVLVYSFVESAPLEMYHNTPRCFLTTHKGPEMTARAKLRAQELKKRACRERKKLDPSFDVRISGSHTSPMGALLHTASMNLGRTSNDVPIYEARLEEQWYNAPEQLKGLDVEFLSCYMPHRLASEVHRLVESEYSDTSPKIT